MRIIGTIAVTVAMVCGAVATAAAFASTHSSDAPAHHETMMMPMGMDMSAGANAAALPASQLARARARDGQVRERPGCGQSRRLQHPHAEDPRHGLPLHQPVHQGVRRPSPADPRLRAAWQSLAARRARVGLPGEARDAPAEGSHLRRLPGRVSLQGRHVRGQAQRRCLRAGEPTVGIGLQLLASRPRHDARLDLVSESGGPVREHEPARARLQVRTASGARRPARPA